MKNLTFRGANRFLGAESTGATLTAETSSEWNPATTPRSDAIRIADWLFEFIPGLTFEALREIMSNDPRYRI